MKREWVVVSEEVITGPIAESPMYRDFAIEELIDEVVNGGPSEVDEKSEDEAIGSEKDWGVGLDEYRQIATNLRNIRRVLTHPRFGWKHTDTKPDKDGVDMYFHHPDPAYANHMIRARQQYAQGGGETMLTHFATRPGSGVTLPANPAVSHDYIQGVMHGNFYAHLAGKYLPKLAAAKSKWHKPTTADQGYSLKGKIGSMPARPHVASMSPEDAAKHRGGQGVVSRVHSLLKAHGFTHSTYTDKHGTHIAHEIPLEPGGRITRNSGMSSFTSPHNPNHGIVVRMGEHGGGKFMHIALGGHSTEKIPPHGNRSLPGYSSQTPWENIEKLPAHLKQYDANHGKV